MILDTLKKKDLQEEKDITVEQYTTTLEQYTTNDIGYIKKEKNKKKNKHITSLK
jgi:hypothetical protein